MHCYFTLSLILNVEETKIIRKYAFSKSKHIYLTELFGKKGKLQLQFFARVDHFFE